MRAIGEGSRGAWGGSTGRSEGAWRRPRYLAVELFVSELQGILLRLGKRGGKGMGVGPEGQNLRELPDVSVPRR